MFWFYILIFLISCFLLFWIGRLLIDSLIRIARFLKWREFVVAFFIIAFTSSLPNFFVGISSAFQKIPELSFAEIVGGNVVDLTLAMALAVLVVKSLPTESRLIQASSIFTIIIALLPFLLILDGILGRGDGLILILTFLFYISWIFSKEERFRKVYQQKETSLIKEFKIFLLDLGKMIFGIIILLLAGEGVVRSARFFIESLEVSLPLIGILIVGLGNAFPETYVAIISAKKKENWMILGNLMGAVIVPASLVLGIVTLICPIEIVDFSPYVIARFFLIISALFFFFFVRTGKKITKKEGLFLLGIYITFVIIEILSQKY